MVLTIAESSRPHASGTHVFFSCRVLCLRCNTRALSLRQETFQIDCMKRKISSCRNFFYQGSVEILCLWGSSQAKMFLIDERLRRLFDPMLR